MAEPGVQLLKADYFPLFLLHSHYDQKFQRVLFSGSAGPVGLKAHGD